MVILPGITISWTRNPAVIRRLVIRQGLPAHRFIDDKPLEAGNYQFKDEKSTVGIRLRWKLQAHRREIHQGMGFWRE
jgi:hypothetical protein